MLELDTLPTRWRWAIRALGVACVLNAGTLWHATWSHPAVTIVTPWVAPGDDALLDVRVAQYLEAARVKTVTEERMSFRVPADLPVGASFDLQLSDRPEGEVAVHLPVLSPLERSARRIVSGLCGVASLLLLLGLSTFVVEPRIRESQSPRITRAGVRIIVAPFALFFVAEGVFKPVAAALSLGTTDGMWLGSLLLVIALGLLGPWLLGPPRSTVLAGAFAIVGPPETGAYRAPAPREPTLDDLVGAIARTRTIAFR